MIDVQSSPAMRYAAPTTIEEAISLLGQDEGAKLVAGGQSLLVFLRQGLLQPSTLVGLRKIPDLARLEVTPDGRLAIGAMVTQQALASSPLFGQRWSALQDAASVVASPLVRRQGTIGGNLCHADPTADPPAALIALDAEVEIASEVGRRRLPVASFFADYMETVLTPAEVLTAVHLPAPAPRSGSAYLKHRLRGVDTALVGAGVWVALSEDGSTVEDARIGLAGAGVTPLRASAAEAHLSGAPLNSDRIAAAAAEAAADCEPLADTEGSDAYRREMVAVFVRRAAERAIARAQETESHG